MPATLPATMTAIEITEPGGPHVLKPGTRPVPVPGRGEILVKVAAAGINRPDVFQRLGGYPPPPGASDSPGLEVAGTVAAAGPDANEWAEDGSVCALVSGGGYAEYCVVPVPQALPVPSGLGLTETAALPETFFTVWANVFDRARLKDGETLLVHGGSSGIGTTAIQMARVMGATVLTTAGSAEKCAACTDLGAARAINYREEDFVAVVAEETADGANVILDMVAGPYIPRDLDCLALEGRLVVIALLGGSTAEIDLNALMRRRLTLTGSTLRPQSVEAKGMIAAALRRHIWPHLESGAIRPVIDSTFPLAEAAKAHARMESGAHIGNIVLTV